jgi:hypothetical protein
MYNVNVSGVYCNDYLLRMFNSVFYKTQPIRADGREKAHRTTPEWIASSFHRLEKNLPVMARHAA